MIFPRGEVVHRNLSTAYTDFPALLSTLKSGDFSGIIEIEFPESKGTLFVESGESLNAEAKIGADSKRMIGQEAIQTLMALSNQKEGVINIYRLSPERVAIVASNLQHEILFKGLSTDFTRLDRLLLKLREDKHNGFIEVLTKEHQAMGVLFLEGGEPVEMFTTPESGPSVFGRKSIPIFVENAIKQGAIFDVYRSQGKILKKEIKEIKEIKEKKVPGRAEGLKELIPILQEVLSQAEKLVDGASRKKGLFHKLFKESLVEKSEEFTFLDPFAGEFDYREGAIQFTGEIGVKDFSKGIVECLVATLSLLEKELPKDKILPLKLKAGIESSLEQHGEALKRLGVEAITSSIFK
ncbi:MAG: hypothetical protein A2026_21390 [Deltaproteobacteria bacterium RBG_19FT_COMBO_46_12]|nr:MAG: hypothetical protein A2026_21390 [Deltaproteobacteria bacterium RBG_19FT_COMBO_46_12]